MNGLVRFKGRCGLVALVVGALLVALAVTACGGSNSGTAESGYRGSRPPLESILEDDVQLEANPAATLDTLRRLGVARVRLFVPWGALDARIPIAPDATSRTPPSGFHAGDPAAYPASGWAIYDTIIRDAAVRGIGIDLTLSAPAPLWATGPGEPPGGPTGVWKPSASAYGQFVRAVATRYSGHFTPAGSSKPLPRIDFWGIWNEPNLGIDLGPQSIDKTRIEVTPALYRGLLDAAWSALQQTGHGHDTILIGELAPQGITCCGSPGTFGYMVPLRFLRALYCVDSTYQQLRGSAAAARGCPTTAAGSASFRADNPALFDAPGFADHPYPQAAPNQVTPGEPDYADLPVLSRLESALDTVQRVYGSGRQLPIYSTEFGIHTNPPETVFGSVSPQVAAYYLNWSEYISWLDPRLRSYDQYLLVDPASARFATALETANGQPKPGFYAYRIPIYLPVTSASSGQGLEVWGCVRPSRYARLDTGKAQQVKIQFQASAGAPFKTVRIVTLTDPYGYFDVRQSFSGSGNVRLAWSYPHGPEIFSRTVGVTIR